MKRLAKKLSFLGREENACRSWAQWAEEPYPTLVDGDDLSPNDQLLKPVLQYEPLPEDTHGTRLLHINPHLRRDGLLDCRLINVKFGDKPKFDALSYMWGDASTKKKICVNNYEFEVTENLFDALHFLRRRPDREEWLPMWIDAICINQEGTVEKDQQLPLMPHIYERARQVLVWLGKGYEEFQKPKTEDRIRRGLKEVYGSLPDYSSRSVDVRGVRTVPLGRDLGGPTEVFKKAERAMVVKLSRDPYWERVWIVQEIAKARQIKVCFGKITLNWAEVMYLVRRYSLVPIGPLQFVDTKDDQKLMDLLESHKLAKCALPKDKIYGLLGLSRQSRGFPVHYDRSDSDTWVDTVFFVDQDSLHLMPPRRAIQFARLVRTLLFDHPNSQAPDLLGISNRPEIISLEGLFIGCVESIGPLTSEIFSNLDAMDEWEDGRGEKGKALKRLMLDSKDGFIESLLVSSFANTLGSARQLRVVGEPATITTMYNAQAQENNNVTRISVPLPDRLFKWRSNNGKTSKLGFVPNGARPGDALCYMGEPDELLVLRVTDDQSGAVHIVGKGKLQPEKHDLFSYLLDRPHNGDFEEEDMSLVIDATTLWQLTS